MGLMFDSMYTCRFERERERGRREGESEELPQNSLVIINQLTASNTNGSGVGSFFHALIESLDDKSMHNIVVARVVFGRKRIAGGISR